MMEGRERVRGEALNREDVDHGGLGCGHVALQDEITWITPWITTWITMLNTVIDPTAEIKRYTINYDGDPVSHPGTVRHWS